MSKVVLVYIGSEWVGDFERPCYKGDCPDCGETSLEFSTHPNTQGVLTMDCNNCEKHVIWWGEEGDPPRLNVIMFDKLADFMTYKVQVKLLELLEIKELDK